MLVRILIPIFFFLVHENLAQAQHQMKFEVEGLSCQNCANATSEALKKIQGVKAASVSFDTKSASLVTDGTVSQKQIKKAVERLNFEAYFESDQRVVPLTSDQKKKLDIQVIAGGEKLSFQNHLKEGKISIFDFFAEWCGPCRLFTPKLERLVFENPNRLALTQVDVVTWKSPLARQLTKEYKIPALPFTLIFDDKGRLLGQVAGNNLEAVKQIITPK